MRGHDEQTAHMFSYLSPEQRVPADHPLRAVRALTDEALQTMSRRFASLYATTGRPSIPPEQLLRALLLQVLYTVRSERLLMEALTDNLLFRWFVGLNMDDPVWHPTTFTKNRDRLLSGDVAAAFFDAVQAHARAAGLLSDEHFTVDGTQLEAWASLKSFRCVDAAESDPPEDPGNPTVNFHGERRRNDTHQSTTDPEAMLQTRRLPWWYPTHRVQQPLHRLRRTPDGRRRFFKTATVTDEPTYSQSFFSRQPHTASTRFCHPNTSTVSLPRSGSNVAMTT